MAAKKPGPKTAAAKAITSQNAIAHGMRSERPVIPGIESQQDWEAHRDGIVEAFAPQGGLQLALAERVASLLWRLHRVTRYEVAVTSRGIERTRENYAEAKATAEVDGYLPISITPEVVDRELAEKTLPDYGELDKIMRYESHLHRQCLQALHEIEALQERSRGKQTPLARFDISAPPAG